MYNRIEICGSIASGKSSLTMALSKFSGNMVFEDFSKIAMLDDFYSDPSAFSFETEISFTLQHYYQLKKTRDISNCAIADFSIADDYAFALVTLRTDEMHIYEQISEHILSRLSKPQKLIRLRASAQTLLNRIYARGRANEQNIAHDYLIKLENSIDEAIKTIYPTVPIIEIDTDKYALTDYTSDFLKAIIS